MRLRLDAWQAGAHLYALWWEVFGENMLNNDHLWGLERQFVQRVQLELFPLDEMMVSDLLSSEEGVLEYAIPLRGWRVPWEVAHPTDLPAHQQVICACFSAARLGLEDEFDWMGAAGGEEIDLDDPQWSPLAIGAEHTKPVALDLPWLYEDASRSKVEAALGKLTALPGPAGGLSDLMRASLDLYPGPFLALPEGPWVCEYVDYGWDWNARDIRELTRLYSEARPVIRRIQAFRRWFDDTAHASERGAHEAVLRMLEATL